MGIQPHEPYSKSMIKACILFIQTMINQKQFSIQKPPPCGKYELYLALIIMREF